MKTNPVATNNSHLKSWVICRRKLLETYGNNFYVGLENCLKRVGKINFSIHSPVLGFCSQAEWIWQPEVMTSKPFSLDKRV